LAEPGLIDDVASAGAFGASGGGVFFILRWLWLAVTGRLDRREARLDALDVKVDLEWQKIREELQGRLGKLEQQNEALRFAFHHVSVELIRHAPESPALRIAQQLLSQAFPIDLNDLAYRAEEALARNAAQ